MLKFITNHGKSTAIGTYGTHYTIAINSFAPIVYYVEGVNVEFDTYTEAVAYCEALEAEEVATKKCYILGVRSFCDMGEALDFCHSAIDEMCYIYCPTTESAKAFIALTKCCVDTYHLSHATIDNDLSYTNARLYRYDAHSDSYTPMDSALCAIMSQIAK